ncbi:biotin transport system permease protein [Arthrobacter silviterrae]|uniref:Energy-coupling factor transporter transmembrane protein EcfT n=1 Tax=Arthrobacter silviterrae TaxID=2026658 RepID=A0ABX0DB17_9MICC|nr:MULTISPECIES: energy-coupling factor transporter transmembrane component T [Arthrobacter]MCU6482090.1 energy-coupling factor transporter transmembrane protein EcfT [Arthrobacter sp. A2-55]MDQ0276150.1 biotin transport system permease protein [Arthrobacter silviterrae]NGN82615.1 energy-coupling factor transporter transmembrane protein EcfT [Arthrobacter silviterrae]
MRGHAHLVASYIAGNSPFHRMALWRKAVLLLAVAVLCLASPAISVTLGVIITTAVLIAAIAAHGVAGLPWGRLWRAVRIMVVFLVLIAAYQWWQHGPATAWQVVAAIVATVLASNILTATTPVDELLDGLGAVVRPLERFGADPERFSLTVALMLRSIPFVIGAFSDVRDAARARGLERNLMARSLPVVIATVGYARATGEALAARGLGDPELPGEQ